MNQTSETPLLPGMKPVLELLRTDPQRIDLVFCKKGLRTRDAQDVQQLCRQSGVRFSLVDQAALDRLCREAAQQNGNDAAPLNHQGVVARLTATDFRDLADVLQAAAEAPLPLVVALDQVQDPGNVGTLCRTLYALGGAGVILPRHNSAYLGPAPHAGGKIAWPPTCVNRKGRRQRGRQGSSPGSSLVFWAAAGRVPLSAYALTSLPTAIF